MNKLILAGVFAAALLAAAGFWIWRSRSPRHSATTGRWTTELTDKNGKRINKRMLTDPSAQSADPSKPAFLAPPPGAKVYSGFPLIRETTIDGFTFGSITDFLEKDTVEGCTIGDGFVEAPDGTRAGIFWEVGDELMFSTVVQPDETRWGVYAFTVPKPVKSVGDLKSNFSLMLPVIKELYERTHKP